MRSRRLPRTSASVAIAIAATGIAGVGIGAAATKAPTYKACATSKNVLSLAAKNGKCAKGTHAIALNARGPQGATGPKGDQGPKGDTGGKGDPGTASTIALHYAQATADSLTATPHTLGTLDGITMNATCFNDGAGNGILDVEAASTSAVRIRGGGVESLSGTAQTFVTFSDASPAHPTVELFAINAAPAKSSTLEATFVVTGTGHGEMSGTLFLDRITGGTADCDVEGTLTDGPIPTS